MAKRKIPSEQKDRILKEVHGQIDSYSKEGRRTSSYAVDLKQWLQDQEGVDKATIRGGNTITVEFSDGTRVGVLLDRKEKYGGSDFDIGEVRIRPGPIQPVQAAHWMHSHRFRRFWTTPGTKNALLFDPLYDDWPPEATTDDIQTALQGAGFSVTTMLGNAGDLAHLETIENNQYGVIFIRSHGGILNIDGDDKIHIMVRPFFDSYPDPAASGYDGIEVFFVGTDWGYKYAYAFNEDFVRNHLGAVSFPNTLMHLLVCHGGDPTGSDDLIDAFLDFGVGCYTGWTRNATLAHGDPTAVTFFEYLCGDYNRTVAGALNQIQLDGHSPDPLSGAELVGYGSCATMRLLAPPRVVVTLDEEHLKVLDKFPGHEIEIVVEAPKGVHIPDWSPWGGMLTPVDRVGRRRFIPYGQRDSFTVAEGLDEMYGVIGSYRDD
jgi:hypothetical protein